MDVHQSLVAIFGCAFFAGCAAQAAENETPPIPYYDHGACPFECCTYREWTATTETMLRKDFNDSSPVVGTVKSQEQVRGLTGVVITTKAGTVKILKVLSLHREDGKGQVALKPGDIVYNLHYVGAGYDKLWFKGQLLVDQTDIRKAGKTEWWEVIDLPTWVWWAKVQKPSGEIGWTRELKNFQHIDKCE
jgi:hypothetical protein